MRIAAALSEARALARTAARARERYGVGRLAAARRARRLRRLGGFRYHETLAVGLLDPSMEEAEALRHVSEHATTRVLDRLNPESLAAFTAEKLIFYRYFAARGMPVPALYGVVGRAGGWSAASARPLVGVHDCAAFLAEEPPDEFVVKPSGGHHGFGVRVLRREGGELVDLEGRRWAPAALAAELAADPEFDLFVVQERLRNHERVQRLLRSETLQTVRVTTFVSDEGVPQVLHAYLRLAAAGLNVDNVRGGALANATVEVDLTAGTAGPPHGPGAGAVGEIEGQALPGWEAACEVVRRGALLLMPQRSMGWDLALTTGGPVIVEANRGYDPFANQRFGAVVRAIDQASRQGGPAVPEDGP
jgi:hypothetical protein